METNQPPGTETDQPQERMTGKGTKSKEFRLECEYDPKGTVEKTGGLKKGEKNWPKAKKKGTVEGGICCESCGKDTYGEKVVINEEGSVCCIGCCG